MNDLNVTIAGWVATDPRLNVTKTGNDVVSFRLATTSRFFNRATNEWLNRPTEWFTVRVFRAAAVLVQRSVHKGQPVIVVGRLRTNEWTSQNGPRVDLTIEAVTVGHDLTLGVAEFRRAVADADKGSVEELAAVAAHPVPPADDEAEPIDVSDLEEGDDEELDGLDFAEEEEEEAARV